ncbi:uncharacterized protein LOC129579418 [Sitodiplosis mosellana]|uniref:uncharacterized protein LOC129579418 n=1 Tax=Sitodiplosis mosellana TaxID=263140 RepID=UPI0024446B84|nr:uncharacterized protein LOC129579418 [Sitodiplosis mosellana]
MSDAAKAAEPGRPMKYPYTFSAKIAQFPYKFYLKNSWLTRYWLIGIVASLPLWYKIHKAVNSPGNVAVWKEKERKEAEEHAHH